LLGAVPSLARTSVYLYSRLLRLPWVASLRALALRTLGQGAAWAQGADLGCGTGYTAAVLAAAASTRVLLVEGYLWELPGAEEAIAAAIDAAWSGPRYGSAKGFESMIAPEKSPALAGRARCAEMDMEPALCPMTVTRAASPPKAPMF
jgi:hypothetical protein